MAYTTINKSTDHFNTKLYAGTGSTHNVTGVGFQPDWTWIKSRTDTGNHRIYDAVRGATKTIFSNLTNAEGTNTNGLSSFDSDGFTVNTNTQSNGSGNNFVAWNWKAGTGQGSSNTDGSINTTYTSVNTTAGFSISKYTGTGSNATVGHGLSAAPKMILFRNLTNSSTAWNWGVYHKDIGAGNGLHLNNTEALSSQATSFNSTDPTTNVFSVGSWGGTNYSGDNYIAYCFAEKTGYSKFGSYTGNNNVNGTFFYCGFKPAFVMIKNSAAAEQWRIYDSKREPSNHMFKCIFPNANNAENTTDNASEEIDFVSNGIKIRSNSQQLNGNGQKLIYMAFGQSLVGSNNVPCTAR